MSEGIDRRAILLGSGAAGAGLLLPAAALSAGSPRGADALPMPATDPSAPAPRPLPADPSLLRLDDGWLFHPGDIPMPVVKGHGWTYANAKAGGAQGAAAMGYDDSEWTPVALPHDWVVEQPFDPDANISQGYRARGTAWYRRHLALDPALKGRYLELQLGAVSTNATVWFNGIDVAYNHSGYNRITVDISAMARFGDERNVIVVRDDATTMEGWWYEGGGLYRHAWLAVRSPVHIETDGVHADPRHRGGESWEVPVAVDLGNVGEASAVVRVSATLSDAAGRVLARETTDATVAPLVPAVATLSLPVDAPARWSPDSPALHELRVELVQDGTVIDTRRLRLGFRTLRFDAATGFHLNEQPTKVKGVCVHQDHAGVGVAVPDALWDFRIRRLKAMGCNAIRIAHHAPATELLDACDRLGMLVMDENRHFNVAELYLDQLRWLVRRDRNRPSVFLWSVFNEEPMQGSPQGYEMVRRMAATVKALDTSRPVTAAMNDGIFTPLNVSGAVDVVGFNYHPQDYDRFHREHPDKPITSSEDVSSFQVRGVYATEKAAHVIASYDNAAADWGNTHREAWKAVATRPFVAGCFVWTGFDYRGEPTPFDWPTASSLFGCMDLCGFPKQAFHLHRAQWVDDRPVLAIEPHWTWPGREGQPITVQVLTNAERVRLLLNGVLVGEQAVDRYTMPEWKLPYAPGRLEAIGYRAGREVAREAVETAGPPVALRLTPDRAVMTGDGEDVQPVTVDAIDAAGRHVPTANLPVTFAITGGSMIGLGNGDPNSHEPEKGDRRSLFNGLAQVIVRAEAGDGALTLVARSGTLRAAKTAIERRAATPRPSLSPSAPRMSLDDGWRRSPVPGARPTEVRPLADNDMNSWLWTRPGAAEAGQSPGWIEYRATFEPFSRVRRDGGTIRFASVVGRADVWLDGRLVSRKQSAAPAPLDVALAPGPGRRSLAIAVEVDGGGRAGLAGPVLVGDR